MAGNKCPFERRASVRGAERVRVRVWESETVRVEEFQARVRVSKSNRKE